VRDEDVARIRRGLAEFILARIAEDEAACATAAAGEGWYVDDFMVWVLHDPDGQSASGLLGPLPIWADGAVDHIARWDPIRVLAECAMKRRIVEECGFEFSRSPDSPEGDLSEFVLNNLAHQYADHPDHQPEWKWQR
jgi:hypothetical protein